MVYSARLNLAAYLLNQQITRLMMSEVHESLLPQAKQRKLTRVEGYNEMKGFSHALSSIGLSLLDFAVPAGLVLRPLDSNELLVKGPDGTPFISNPMWLPPWFQAMSIWLSCPSA